MKLPSLVMNHMQYSKQQMVAIRTWINTNYLNTKFRLEGMITFRQFYIEITRVGFEKNNNAFMGIGNDDRAHMESKIYKQFVWKDGESLLFTKCEFESMVDIFRLLLKADEKSNS